MLNIPESIKTLFKTDGVRKNFRAHFPNGEYSDITNSDVVAESVKFTESLCSQDVFKFGLAEASVLEFETVGVGNMYGMTIEAGIEIDTSSLSAADISTIQAGTWDGTLVLAAASDIGYGFFRVPLGVFRVESCPRNHGAMTHRQVTAYTLKIGKNLLSDFEMKRASLYKVESSEIFDVFPYCYAQLGNADASFRQNGFTKTVLCDSSNMTSFSDQYLGETSEDGQYRIRVTFDRLQYNTTFTDTDIVGVDKADIDLAGAYDFLQNAMAQYGVKDKAMNPAVRISDVIGWCMTINGANYGDPKDNALGVVMYDNVPMLYPRLRNYTSSGFRIPTHIKLELRTVSPAATIAEFETQSTASPFVYSYTPIETLPQVLVSVGSSGEDIFTVGGNKMTLFSYVDCFNPAELLQGAVELYAKFVKAERTGGLEMLALDDSNPTQVVPGDYMDCWWDEYDVDPIGIVTVKYKSTNTSGQKKEDEADIYISDGQSWYDMTDNETLEQLSNTSFSSLVTMIGTCFAPYVGTAIFTPIELTMQGWPWIEAGDALEITAEDGTLVETYALRIEITGIQNLMANITAQGGQIIEEVE